MKKAIKITSLIIAIFLILVIVLPIAFKGKILRIAQDEMNKQLNAVVTIGDVNISLIKGFPNLYIGLEQLTITGVDEFKQDTLVSFKTFSIKLDLISAIKMENIQVKSILLDQPVVNAIILKNGKANWDIMKPSSDTAIAETPVDTTTSEETKFSVKLKKFQINNALINYNDQSSNMSAILKNLNFTLKGDMTQDRTDLDIKATVDKLTYKMDGISFIKEAQFKLNAIVAADMVNSLYVVSENEMSLNDLIMGVTGSIQLMKDESIVTDLKYSTRKTDFKTLLSLVPAIYMTDFTGLQAKGVLKLDGTYKGIMNDSIMPSADLTLLVENAMFNYPGMPKAAENINIDLKVHYDGVFADSTKVDLDKFHIEMAKNPFDAMLKIRTPESDMQLTATAKGKIDFASIQEIIPLDSMTLSGLLETDLSMMGKMSSIEKEQYEDFNALGFLKLTAFNYISPDLPNGITIKNMEMKFSPRFVDLSAFSAIMGKSDFQLQGKLENFIPYVFSNDTIRGSLNFTSNLLDLNEFMAEETTSETTTTTTAQQEPVDTAPLSVIEIPANIDFKLNSALKKIIFDKLEITDLSGSLIVKNSILSMNNVKMNMLDGSLLMSGYYNVQDTKNPAVNFVLKINGFDIPASFKAFNTIQKIAPIAEKCQGKYSMDLSFTSLLDNQMNPVLNSFNGNGLFTSNNVTINNASIFEKLSALLEDDKYKTINVNDLNIKFKIENGRIYLSPFDLKFGSSKMIIAGDQGIDQTMNYTISTAIPNSALGTQASQALSSLITSAASKGINLDANSILNIDALVTGTTSDPKISLQFKNASAVTQSAKEQITQKVQETAKQVVDDGKAKARAEAERLLQQAKIEAEQIRSASQNSAETVRREGYAAADRLVKEAKDPISKKAAEITAKKMKQEADTKANNIINEGNQKADALIQQAQAQVDKLK